MKQEFPELEVLAINSILVNEQGRVLIPIAMYYQWLKAVRGHVRLSSAHETTHKQFRLEYVVIRIGS